MHAMLTTVVANYEVKPEQYLQAREAAYLLGNDALFQLWNGAGELIQSIGKTGVVPAIWTHTPVPMGFDLIALKQQFEERAASVLGDYDQVVHFIKCKEVLNHSIEDNRYYDPTVRAAWMMYLDQAIEHHEDTVMYSNI